MAERGGKDKGPELPTSPGWMVTYGDMMSLLLVFFVMIVSFSSIEANKFRAVLGSFRGALLPWSPGPTGMTMVETTAIRIAEEMMEQIATEMQTLIAEEHLSEYIEVHVSGGGVKFVFTDPVLFDVGKDKLKARALPILKRVAELAQKGEMEKVDIMIEGHTDDTPIHTDRFPSNWELSASRAIQVLKFFQANGVAPQRLVAVGYGEYRPRVKVPSSASSEAKAPNRRVEVFLNFAEQNRPAFISPDRPVDSDHWVE